MTAIFVAVGVSVQLVLGLGLALLFNREMPGRSFLRTLMILPIFATPVACGYLFFTIFYEEGGPLGWTGIPWLSSPSWALVSVIIVDVWQWTPFCFLVFLAALQGIPDELIEAARLDGGAGWTLFKEVILPLMAPTIVIVFLLRLAEAMKVFDVVASLTVGGPGNATQSMSYLAFRTGLRFFDVGYASAIAYTLLAFVMVVVTLFFKRVKSIYALRAATPACAARWSTACAGSWRSSPRWSSSSRSTGRSRPPCATRPTPSPSPASASRSSTSRRRSTISATELSTPEGLRALRTSIIVSVSATLLALIIGMPAAYALARFRFWSNADITVWFLSQRVLPPVATLIPFYLTFRAIRPARHALGADPGQHHLRPALRRRHHAPDLPRPAGRARGGGAGRRCRLFRLLSGASRCRSPHRRWRPPA